MIEIQNQEYWKKLFEEEIKILTPQEIEEIKIPRLKNIHHQQYGEDGIFFHEKDKTIRMEEETISMTMEEDNK
ncbi:hypothetical protein ENUP19_0153G0013 [Entamoeba nuttalli]|uniref:Uncharacterized protein n=1 Tax=Entamoeba nuttalli TaxID=412467 RepID=A0ABQ0DL34_9EUKA